MCLLWQPALSNKVRATVLANGFLCKSFLSKAGLTFYTRPSGQESRLGKIPTVLIEEILKFVSSPKPVQAST